MGSRHWVWVSSSELYFLDVRNWENLVIRTISKAARRTRITNGGVHAAGLMCGLLSRIFRSQAALERFELRNDAGNRCGVLGEVVDIGLLVMKPSTV